MTSFRLPGVQSSPLVKDSLASLLREEIIAGRLAPGERIIEGKWASKLNVAQASIREALNILAAEGFVQRGRGRSARVIELSAEDVVQIYEMRSALETLAARLIMRKRPDLSDLDQAIADMRSAALCNNVRAFYERDIRFHLLLAEKAGNRFLEQELRRLIIPLFAFVVMRVHGAVDEPERWERSIAEHQQILGLLRGTDPEHSEREIARINQQFFVDTYTLMAAENSEWHRAIEVNAS
jgi:DNA-binding GntR family transcriptional regulator